MYINYNRPLPYMEMIFYCSVITTVEVLTRKPD